MRVLVTGASGFIGRHVYEALAGEAMVTRVGRTASASCDIAVNLGDSMAVGALVETARPNVVVHFAAISAPAVARADIAAAFAVNAGATAILANTVRAHAPQAHFILAGSGLSYGASFFDTALPLPESAPLRPLDVYSSTKVAAEVALGPAIEAGLSVTVLRFFNVIGPGQSIAFAVPSFAARIAAIEAGRAGRVLHTSRLDEGRDFVDVRDAAQAVGAVARGGAPGHRVFNVSSGRTHLMRAVLDRMLAQSKVRIEVAETLGEGRPLIASGAPDAIAAAVGWRATIPLDATLADIMQEHRMLERGAP